MGSGSCEVLGPTLTSWLQTREHELVTGLAQFDLQAPKGPEEPAQLTGMTAAQ